MYSSGAVNFFVNIFRGVFFSFSGRSRSGAGRRGIGEWSVAPAVKEKAGVREWMRSWGKKDEVRAKKVAPAAGGQREGGILSQESQGAAAALATPPPFTSCFCPETYPCEKKWLQRPCADYFRITCVREINRRESSGREARPLPGSRGSGRRRGHRPAPCPASHLPARRPWRPGFLSGCRHGFSGKGPWSP